MFDPCQMCTLLCAALLFLTVICLYMFMLMSDYLVEVPENHQ